MSERSCDRIGELTDALEGCLAAMKRAMSAGAVNGSNNGLAAEGFWYAAIERAEEVLARGEIGAPEPDTHAGSTPAILTDPHANSMMALCPGCETTIGHAECVKRGGRLWHLACVGAERGELIGRGPGAGR